MGTNLVDLTSEFATSDDIASPVAIFRTRTPWIAPEAFLHVVYGPAPPELIDEVNRRLLLPKSLVDQLRVNNGAILFGGALTMFGAVGSRQLLNRADPYSLPPFSLEEENLSARLPEDVIVIGCYETDGSQVVLRRDNGIVRCDKPDGQPLAFWTTIDEWLRSEYERLRQYFNREGRLLNEEHKPSPPEIVQ